MSDPTAAVAAAPFVAAFEPYAIAIIGAVVTTFVGVGVSALQKWTGVHIDATMQATLANAAATEAGALVAQASDNLARRSINAGSPIVAEAAKRIQIALPDVINATGLTAAEVAQMVAGEIGKLQAQMTAQPIPAAAPK